MNLSHYKLSETELNLLKYGPKHGIRKKFDEVIFKSHIEELFQFLKNAQSTFNNDHNKWRRITNEYINRNHHMKCESVKILQKLRNENISICKFDKGNGLVILDKEDYNKKVFDILNCEKFKKVKHRKNGIPIPISDENKLKQLLTTLKNNNDIDERQYKCLYPCGSQPAKLYGLPKIHKTDIPMRPVLSMINTAQSKVGKFLDPLLKGLIANSLECKNSFDFMQCISGATIESGEVMASFDVSSLFTKIPVKETIEICVEAWNGNNGLTKRALKGLLEFCTQNVRFLFNDEWYEQVDGVAMGSPLAPTLASLFLQSLEARIPRDIDYAPKVYKRYVDDIFLIFKEKEHIDKFLKLLNGLHENIKFTVELENNSTLPFLDIAIQRVDGKYETSTYNKPTDTGLYTTSKSFCDNRYKKGLLSCLFNRAWRLASNFHNATKDINALIQRLKLNGYHEDFIMKILNKTINKFYPDNECKGNTENITDENSPEISPSTNLISERIRSTYILKLPYSDGSHILKNKIKNLVSDGYIDLKIIFKTTKIIDHLSKKSRTPKEMLANLIYQFDCHEDNSSYIGETSRHLYTRVGEHFIGQGTKSVHDHIKSCSNCISLNGKQIISKFKILKPNLSHENRRRITESICIKKFAPTLNKQTDFVKTVFLFND